MNGTRHPRVQALERVFVEIAQTRMRDVPVQNLALRVQAIAFEPHTDPAGEALLGVLVTPWFMNLVRLPQHGANTGGAALAVGQNAARQVGGQRLDFIGAHEESLGAFEVCSLFSPMFEFADHDVAVATAHEVLKLLRTPELRPQRTEAAVPSRRGFLLGRGRQASATP
jgi:[NiFe] hydrogenase assembly HybE family chaperone